MITRFAIQHNVAVVVLCIGIIVMGSACYLALPRENFPDVKVPVVVVTTMLKGANPTDVETSLTIPLETELDGIEGLKEMKSTSAEEVSTIVLEFDPDVKTEVSLNRVRDKVDIAKADLPPEAEEPLVQEFSFTNIPVLIYNVAASEKVALSEIHDLAEKLQDELEAIPGVLGVDLYGGRKREVLIELDLDRLHFYQLSFDQAIKILKGTNSNISAGASEGPTSRILMRAPGEFKSPEEIFNLVVGNSPQGVPIYMRDVAMVRYSFEDEGSRARVYDFAARDGESFVGHWVKPLKSISLHVKKRAGENLLEIVRQAEEIVKEVPVLSDVRIIKALDQSKDVNMMISDLENNIGTALILVLAVMFVGLGARNAVLVALCIPFSMLISFIALHIMGQTLNMVVLFSLILALGMLVDNAIVIVENIYRHHSMGASRLSAAIEGTQEMSNPVVASTVTTVAAFFPMLFWPGIMGEFMQYLPLTVITVLTSSLFVALVINPTLTSIFVRLKENAPSTYDPETHKPTYAAAVKYGKMLRFMLERPGWTLTNAFLLLIFSFTLYFSFGSGVEFFPSLDPNNCTLSVTPPEGTSLEESDRMCTLLENRIFGKPDSGYDTPVQNLKRAGITIGLGGGASGSGLDEENMGPVQVQIEFVDRDHRTQSTGDTVTEIRDRINGLDEQGKRVTFPLYGAEFDVFTPQEGPPTGKPLSIDIFGEDLNRMARVVRDMKSIMGSLAGVAKPTDDAAVAQPTLRWTIDKGRAGVFGLDHASVGRTLQIAVGGLDSGTFGHGDDEQDIVLRMPEAYRLHTNLLQHVMLPLPRGGVVPISAVASVRLEPGPVTIKHFERKRVLNAGAEVQPGIREDALIRRMFQERIRQYPFPSGITYRFGGAAEEQQKAQDFLFKAFVIALFSIMMVLVIQFNSIWVPLIVMCSVVLSLMGVFLGLVVFQAPFGIIMSGIGVISLAGIVVNNAIVLLDAIRKFESRGLKTLEAIVTAAMIRFRPVILTAVTTILGLIPMAAKVNLDFKNLAIQYNTDSSQWWQSMALAIIFGLLVATVLTLGVVPTLYLVYSRAKERLSWFFSEQGETVRDRVREIPAPKGQIKGRTPDLSTPPLA
jgi:multidrug efflux pump subunit AcrB